LEFVNAKKSFDEMQEKRDDFLIKSVAEYSGPEFDVVVVFGAAHEFSENVQNYNKRHPERQIGLSRIKWKR
jgi:pheromone shutdown protein TraB